MAYRKISFVPQEFYHVYNRGTDKKVIFKDAADHRRFINLLYLSNSVKPINVRDLKETYSNIFEFERGETLVHIGAYCLMPNHFHILATPRTEGGMETFMKKLGTAYSMYFNKRYERTGSLFEGPYKAKHADSDEYLKYLFAYIHLNPVKLIQPDWKEQEIMNRESVYQYVSTFEYSSLQDHLESGRYERKILDLEEFPEYFTQHNNIATDLFSWLDFEKSPQSSP